MPTFEYLALDTAGRERTGTLTATSDADARALLERRKLFPVRLGAAAAEVSRPRVRPVRPPCRLVTARCLSHYMT